MTTTNCTYEIVLDRDELLDDDDATSDDAICAAFLALATDADATFTDVRVVPSIDTHAFSPADVTLRFVAPTLDDVDRYLRYFDADLATIQPVYDA